MDEYELRFKEYNRGNKENARLMRIDMTTAENLLRENVLRKKQTGYLFLRQKPIGGFILDFYCSKLLLGIEVDGSIHNDRQDYDFQRDERLRHKGIKIIRFTNQEIYNDIKGIRQEILKIIKNL